MTGLRADDRLLLEYAKRVLAAAEGRTDVAAVFTDATIIDATAAPTKSVADRVKDRLPPRARTTTSPATRHR